MSSDNLRNERELTQKLVTKKKKKKKPPLISGIKFELSKIKELKHNLLQISRIKNIIYPKVNYKIKAENNKPFKYI